MGDPFAFPLFPGGRDLRAVDCHPRGIGIVYGALVAMVQPDMKKLVAYSSVSHLGCGGRHLRDELQGLRARYQMLRTASAPADSSCGRHVVGQRHTRRFRSSAG
jgi:hypothetical protein